MAEEPADLFAEVADVDFEELEREALTTTSSRGYVSPLMAQMGKSRLTLDLLASEVPKLRAAEAAAQALPKQRGVHKRAALEKTMADGDLAKERLFAAALPLIRTVAHREWRRRAQWGSQIPLDDLVQDAIVGFFKGLAGFRPEAVRKSPTNYLGQWMLVEMRRSAEVMDHDLQVGHDAGERFRRVRALRSRLMSELGREPTDAEIADASRNPAYLTRPGMVGRAPVDGQAPAIGKGVTVAQVGEERAVRGLVGHAARFASAEEGEAAPAGTIDTERLSTAPDAPGADATADPADLAADADAQRAIARIIEQVLLRMRLPDEQREIIARRYGLAPYEGESSAREISRIMGVHRERVTRVLGAFQEEMSRPGGAFHEVIAAIGEDDLIALGLGWAVRTLGRYDPRTAGGPTAGVLTDPINVPRPSATGQTTSKGILAWFLCDYHDRMFSTLYPDLRAVPRQRDCPSCKKPSGLVRTQEN